jgi:1-acyl-sn-glycerol-3-phosphate acyltransferase
VSSSTLGQATHLQVRESMRARWGRRLLTFTGYLVAAVGAVVFLPLLLLLAGLRDVRKRTNLAAVRCVLALTWYLVCETLGIVASFVLWLASLAVPGRSLDWHYALQNLWARALWSGVRVLFGLRPEISGEAAIGSGPLLVFMRHTSILDTLLPAVFLMHRHGIRLRYVLKRELLWDPCLDVVGQRLPNVFVWRGSEQSAREIEQVRRLSADMDVAEGILVYPEGTRFTVAKRERILDSLASGGDPQRLLAAISLRCVLPPQRGGPLTLLDSLPAADVLFFAHSGLDGATSVREIMDGRFIGRRIEIHFWRVPRSAIPPGTDERIKWLDLQWARMDEWVCEKTGIVRENPAPPAEAGDETSEAFRPSP